MSSGVGIPGHDHAVVGLGGEDGSAHSPGAKDFVGVGRRVGVLLRGGVAGRWQGMSAARGTSEESVPALARTPRFCRDLPLLYISVFFTLSPDSTLWSTFSAFSKFKEMS